LGKSIAGRSAFPVIVSVMSTFNMEVNLNIFKITFLLVCAAGVQAKELSLNEIKDEVIRISKIESLAKQKTEIFALASSFDGNKKANKTGDWNVKVDKSPIDDSESVIMALNAESPIHAWVDDVSTPTLMIRFKEGELDTYFSLGVTPDTEAGDTRTLTLRFDSLPAKDFKGNISTNNKAVFLRDSIELLREISSAQKLTLRFTPFNSNPVTTTFNLNGFNQSASKLFAAANLDLNDKGLMFEDKFRKSLSSKSSYSTFGIYLKNNIVTIETEGGRWKPFARKSAAIDLISNALVAFKNLPDSLNYKLVVNINGSSLTTKQTSDGGLPFSSQELQGLFNDALKKSELDKSLILKVNLNTVEPDYYGNDAPSILVGKVKDTNESIQLIAEL